VLDRKELILNNASSDTLPSAPRSPFRRSIHLRVISTGDNASDLEAAATHNAIFDAGRFGIHLVASPRFADALLVAGPVPRAMQEPLRQCYDAMAEPRLVIAVGASAISGGIHRGGYAGADGVDSVLQASAYIPGNPPHPWYIIHGILLAMGGMPLSPYGTKDKAESMPPLLSESGTNGGGCASCDDRTVGN
jgi:Ni,Fe-hydrogenase III small subunit